jgi:trimethylamine:corrinoid methyltransferase-like protein
VAAGAKTLTERASDRVREILDGKDARLPAPGLVEDLRRIILDDARRNGLVHFTFE